MLIVVTGKSGSGKSALLKATGLKNIFYMDDVVKDIFYIKGHPLYKDILSAFGDVSTDNKIDTEKLGKIVFQDSKKLLELNAMVKPFVRKFLSNLEGDNVIEMAAFLNYYDEYKDLVDKIILIKATSENISEKFNYIKSKHNPIKELDIKYDAIIENDWNIESSSKKLTKAIKGL